MRICKAGLITAGIYLFLAGSAYVYARLHEPGPGYEILPFALLTIPVGLIFRLTGRGLFLGAFANTVMAYVLGWLISRSFSD